MNTIRHFSDTRTEEGRVRFLVSGDGVALVAEGPGWHHQGEYQSLEEARLYLAFLPRLSQSLYEQSLNDLARRLELEHEQVA